MCLNCNGILWFFSISCFFCFNLYKNFLIKLITCLKSRIFFFILKSLIKYNFLKNKKIKLFTSFFYTYLSTELLYYFFFLMQTTKKNRRTQVYVRWFDSDVLYISRKQHANMCINFFFFFSLSLFDKSVFNKCNYFRKNNK